MEIVCVDHGALGHFFDTPRFSSMSEPFRYKATMDVLCPNGQSPGRLVICFLPTSFEFIRILTNLRENVYELLRILSNTGAQEFAHSLGHTQFYVYSVLFCGTWRACEDSHRGSGLPAASIQPTNCCGIQQFVQHNKGTGTLRSSAQDRLANPVLPANASCTCNILSSCAGSSSWTVSVRFNIDAVLFFGRCIASSLR